MFTPLDHHLGTLGWHLSWHAKERISARGVRAAQLTAALTRPDITYPNGDGAIYARGPLALVVDLESHTVLTVLLTGTDAWDDERARAAFAAS